MPHFCFHISCSESECLSQSPFAAVVTAVLVSPRLSAYAIPSITSQQYDPFALKEPHLYCEALSAWCIPLRESWAGT